MTDDKDKDKKPKQVKPRVSPLEIFFSLGDKVTKGDPKKKADFDYYMLWIIFLAFFGVAFGNARNFFLTREFQYLGWTLFGLAIMWFQYFNLKNMRQLRKMQKEMTPQEKVEEHKVESVEEMLASFKKPEKKITAQDVADKLEQEEKKDGDGSTTNTPTQTNTT